MRPWLCRARVPCAVLTVLGLLSPPAHAALSLAASVGFANLFRPSAVSPVCVRIAGQSPGGRARLELRVTSRTGVVVSSQDILLPVGRVDEMHWLYGTLDADREPGAAVVALKQDDRVLAAAEPAGTPLPGGGAPAVVCITPDLAGFAHLTGRDLGLRHRDELPQSYYYGSPPQASTPLSVTTVHPPAALLPDRGAGYAGIDGVVVGDVASDALTDAQWAAIARWVRDGGVLVVSGGADLARLRHPALAAMLPVLVSAVGRYAIGPALAPLLGGAPALGTVPVAVGPLAPGARVVCQAGGVPVVSARRVGTGVVVLAGFDLESPDIRALGGQDRLWRGLFGPGRPELRAVDALLGAASWSGYGRGGMMEALAGAQASRSPGLGVVALYLLAYIVCLVPINYMILWRRDRRELAWITAPAIIVVFSCGAYALGYSLKGSSVVFRTATIAEGTAGNPSFAARTMAGVFSPVVARYDLECPDPDAVMQERSGEGYGSVRAEDLEVERGERTVARGMLVSMWDCRSLAIDSEIRPGGVVDASVSVIGPRRLRVRVTNRMQVPLEACAAVTAGSMASLGSLAPGQSAAADLNLPAQATGRGWQVPMPGGAAVDADGTASLFTAINSAVGEMAVQPGALPPLAFTGWFTGNLAGVRLAVARARTCHAGLLVVHLPAPDGGFALPGTAPWHTIRWPKADGPAGVAGMVPGASAYDFNRQAYGFARRGDLNAAMLAANRAMRLAPNDGSIIDTVAEMHHRRKEYAEAIRYYQLALAHQPSGGSTETHAKYGEALLAVGRRGDAVGEMRKAARDTKSEWGRRAADKLRKLGPSSGSPGPLPPPGP